MTTNTLIALRDRVAGLSGNVSPTEAENIATHATFLTGYEQVELIRALQGSIDAAVALIEHKLPAHAWRVERFMHGRNPANHGKYVGALSGPDDVVFRGEWSAAPALSMILALLAGLILNAKIAEAEEE